MNSTDQQKKYEFICDLKTLSEQYGWSLDEVMDILGFKPKTQDELLVDRAKELYPSGTKFIPIGKQRERVSEGKLEMICDHIFSWSKNKLFVVYSNNEWAEIIN